MTITCPLCKHSSNITAGNYIKLCTVCESKDAYSCSIDELHKVHTHVKYLNEVLDVTKQSQTDAILYAAEHMYHEICRHTKEVTQ